MLQVPDGGTQVTEFWVAHPLRKQGEPGMQKCGGQEAFRTGCTAFQRALGYPLRHVDVNCITPLHTVLVKLPYVDQWNCALPRPSHSKMMSVLVRHLQRSSPVGYIYGDYRHWLVWSWMLEIHGLLSSSWRNRKAGCVLQSKRTEGPRMSSPKVQKPENREVSCLRAREDGQPPKRRERKFSIPLPFCSIEALIEVDLPYLVYWFKAHLLPKHLVDTLRNNMSQLTGHPLSQSRKHKMGHHLSYSQNSVGSHSEGPCI